MCELVMIEIRLTESSVSAAGMRASESSTIHEVACGAGVVHDQALFWSLNVALIE
jgi:hypothetical protein